MTLYEQVILRYSIGPFFFRHIQKFNPWRRNVNLLLNTVDIDVAAEPII